MKLPKKVSRQLSADESLHKYFAYLQREYLRTLERGRVSSVIRRGATADEVLQIERVFDTGDGLVVYVK